MEDVSGDAGRGGRPTVVQPAADGAGIGALLAEAPPDGWLVPEWREEPRPGGFVPSILEIGAFPNDTAAWAAGTVPDGVTATTLGLLRPDALSPTGQLDVVVGFERLAGWVAAQQFRMLAAFAGPAAPGPDPDLQPDPPPGSRDRLTTAQLRERLDKEWSREDVRAALGESALGAGNRIRLARELTGRLTPTLAALEAGTITMRHVRYLTEALAGHTDHTAADVQAAALPHTHTHTHTHTGTGTGSGGPVAPPPDMPAFRRRVHRAILNADPRRAEEKRAAALADRRVAVTDNGDGTTSQFALLSTEGAAILLAAINLIASRHDPGDDRTPDQRRADALVQLARDAIDRYADCPHCHPDNNDTDPGGRVGRVGGGADATSDDDQNAGKSRNPDGHGPRRQTTRAARRRTARAARRAARRSGPTVQVTVALSTLLGLDDQPGELNNEPITATHARRLAADPDATWRRLVTDPLGHLIDYGRTTYKPPARLADHIAARDRTCMFPTCNRPACTCDTDHTLAWADRGTTCEANLAILCCRHHHGKHQRKRWLSSCCSNLVDAADFAGLPRVWIG